MAQQRVGAIVAADTFAPQFPHTTSRAAGRGAIRRSLDRLFLIAVGSALGLLLHSYVVGVVVVDGESMAPSLHGGDQMLIEKVTPRLGVLERGDVVVLRSSELEELLVKRVVATAGEDVFAEEGDVYVDGEALDEGKYAVMSARYFFGEQTVEPDEVFVLGDNRENSDDSATWGAVPVSQVVGRCVTGPLLFQRHHRGRPATYADGSSASESSAGRPVRLAARRTWSRQPQ